MKLKTLYYLLLSLIFFSGCLVGGKYKPPAEPANITYRSDVAVDTTPLQKWFELYKDTVLQHLIQATLDSNKDLAVAVSRIEEARAQTAYVKADMYPKLDMSAQGGGGTAGIEAQKVRGGIDGGLMNVFGTLSWELDIWGKLRHSTRAAQAQFLAEGYNKNALQISLIAEMASEYFLLRDLDNRLMVSEHTLESRKKNTQIISDRFDKGYVAEIDKLQAMQQETIAATTIPNLQRQIVEVENAIRVLMGMGPGVVPRGYHNFDQVLPPDIPVGLPSQLLKRRPDIMASEAYLHAQFEELGVAKANQFPTLSLTGVLGFASPELSTLVTHDGFVANGFGSLTGPLFNFNQRKNAVRIERNRLDQAYYTYQKTVLDAFKDVDNSLAYYKTYSEEYTLYHKQVEITTKALTLTNARYEYGYTTYVEVILMEDNLFDAQNQESQALQGKLNSVVLLYKALGGGW